MFTNITKNKAFIAVYEKILLDTTVRWRDYDGRVIKSEMIKSGTTVIPPADPIRDGYDFMGWDVGPYYRVTFKDHDGSVLQDEYIKGGTSAVPPTIPTRDEYTFTGWDKSYNSVSSDIILIAQYKDNLPSFTVRWLNWNDSVLKTEIVRQSKSATPPIEPTRDGYTFLKWDKEYTSIMGDLDIKATFEVKKNTITFLDEDGSLIGTASVKNDSIIWYTDMKFPMPTKPNRVFSGWSPAIKNTYITKDTTVKATYTAFKTSMFSLNVRQGYRRSYVSSADRSYEVNFYNTDKIIDYMRTIVIDECVIDYSYSNKANKKLTPVIYAWDMLGWESYLGMMDDLEDSSVSTFGFKNGGISTITKLDKPSSGWQEFLLNPTSSGSDTLVWWHKLYGTIEIPYEVKTDQKPCTYLTNSFTESDAYIIEVGGLADKTKAKDDIQVRDGRQMYFNWGVLEETGKADGSKIIIIGKNLLIDQTKDIFKTNIKYFVDGTPIEELIQYGPNRVFGEKYYVTSYTSGTSEYTGYKLNPLTPPSSKAITTYMTINGVATPPTTQVFREGTIEVSTKGMYVPATTGGPNILPVTVKLDGKVIDATTSTQLNSMASSFPLGSNMQTSFGSGKKLKTYYGGSLVASLDDNKFYVYLSTPDGAGYPYYCFEMQLNTDDNYGSFCIRHRN